MTIQTFSASSKADDAHKTLQGLIILLSRSPLGSAYCSVAQAIEWSISDECPAMAHQGRKVKINPEWFRALPNQIRMYWVLHAIVHVIMSHTTVFAGALKRFEDKPLDKLLFGLALDHAVDDMLEEDIPLLRASMQSGKVQNAVEMPENVLRIPQMIGREPSTVYAWLKDNMPDMDEGQASTDQHLPNDDDEGDPQNGNEGDEAPTEPDAMDVQRMLDTFTFQRGMGRTAAGATPSERALFSAAVKPLPWHQIMRNLMQRAISRTRTNTSWRRPSTRGAANNLILPGRTNTPVLSEMVFVIDTSGSINAEDLAEFAEHMTSACVALKPSKVHLLWIDDDVRRVQEFSPSDYETMRTMMKPAGCGGTDMRVALDWVEENLQQKPVGMVIFTDGYTPYPDTLRGYPIWWLINTERIAPPVAGTTIRFRG